MTFWEQALADDTLQYIAPYVRLGQQSDLLRDKADADVLREYASLYCRMLGSLYDNLRGGDPILLHGLICQPFFFGNEPAIDWLGPDSREQLATLVFDQTLPSLRTVRRGSLLPRKRHLHRQAGPAPLLDPFHRDLGR